MTPEDRERMRANARAAMERVDRLNGMGGGPEYGSDERPYPDEILELLNELDRSAGEQDALVGDNIVLRGALAAQKARAEVAETTRGDLRQQWEAGYQAGIRNADHRPRLALDILDGQFQPTDRIGDLHAAMTNILRGDL